MLDVLIRNGWVADGTGSPPFLGDVAIEGGRIVDVGRLGAARDGDAGRSTPRGKIVCPGFVDPHSHSDFSILANPTAESTIRQGVTTEVVGNCGWSYAPVSPASRAVHPQPPAHVRLRRADDPVDDASASTSSSSRTSGHSPNLAWFVGHNAVRLAAGVSGSSAERRAAER